MSTQEKPELRLRQYLLGRLSAAEIEELDELSFLDDDFAAQLQSAEDNLIDDYVRGEIAPDEIVPFTNHYLASPRRREKVNFAQSLQDFTARAYPPLISTTTSNAVEPRIEESAALQSVVPATSTWWRSVLDLFAVPSFVMQTGLAAATVVLFAGGTWMAWEAWRMRGQFDDLQSERTALTQQMQALQQQLARQQGEEAERLRSELQRTQEQLSQLEREHTLAMQQAKPERGFASDEIPNVFSAVLPATERSGGGEKITLAVPADTDFIKLRLTLRSEDYPRFRAVVSQPGGAKPIWQSKPLKVVTQAGTRSLVIALPARLLLAGSYEIATFGLPTGGGAAEQLRNYSFTVVRQ